MNLGAGMGGVKEGEVEKSHVDAVIMYVFKKHETLKKKLIYRALLWARSLSKDFTQLEGEPQAEKSMFKSQERTEPGFGLR